MTLDELIERLELEAASAQDRVVHSGFLEPHSYRGFYEQLAFTPRQNVTIGEMLSAARSARDATFEGYKGGSFTMRGWTDVHLANWGETGDPLTTLALEFLLKEPAAEPPRFDQAARILELEASLRDLLAQARLAPWKTPGFDEACCAAEAALRGETTDAHE